MKIIKIATLAVLALSLHSQNLLASVITYETRAINSAIDSSDFIALWGEQSSTIKSQTLTDFTNVRSGGNTFSNLSVTFDVSSDFASNDWGFQLGLDAGFGGAMFLNGNLIDSTTADTWWAGNWDNAFSASDLLVSEGSNVFEAYWAEDCCNGGNSSRFTTDAGQTWNDLSVENLDATAVPAPAGIALLGLGLLGFAARRKRAIK